jgi:hypothetical protein
LQGLTPCYGKKNVSFESSLNLVWLLLGVIALTCSVRSRRSRVAFYLPRRPWLHVVGTGLIVAALFPYISATDDVLRTEHLSEQHKQTGTSRTSPTNDLMRLYQTLDAPVIADAKQATLTLVFVMLVSALLVQLIDRSTPLQSGRSPPVCIPV